jgi:hypothetical protein
MSTDTKIWFWAHLAVSILVAGVVVTALALLFTDSDLLLQASLHMPIILLFVMPGALLVFGINHLILWRRKPRVIRMADKVVIVIVVALTAVCFFSTFSFDTGIAAAFVAVPLLMIAGVISTIVIAIGNTRAAQPQLSTAPVEPGTAPVGATLDQLFPEEAAVPVASESAQPAEPAAAEPEQAPAAERPTTPYGPKS